MKIALYCRVSTEDQKVDLQLDALRQYSEARQQTVFKEYIDHISGAKDSRPALNEMLADARRRKFDAIVVWQSFILLRLTKKPDMLTRRDSCSDTSRRYLAE